MKKNSSLLFFCVVQVLIFLVLRRFDSFTESKWMLAGLEALLVFVTVSWYVLAQPEEEEKETPSPMFMKSPEKEEDPQIAESFEEKKALEEELKKQEETESFLRQRLQDAEEEKEIFLEKICCAEEKASSQQKTRATCRQTIQELGFEIRKLTKQIGRERREHAIEIRALLRREGQDDTKPPLVPKVAMSPLPAVVSLLASCQKGLERPGEWPSKEHRVLVRRKLFDEVRKTAVTPLIVASLEHPTDLYISSKIEPTLSQEEVFSLIEAYKNEFSQLDHFEPYYFDGQESQWTAFRLNWENLDDIVFLAKTQTPDCDLSFYEG